MSQIDGSEETRGDDGLISDFIRQIDALPEMWAIPDAERKKVMDAHRLAATVEPRGCPTPGACSCPGTIPDADTPPTTAAVVKMLEAGWLSLGSSAPGAVRPLILVLEAFERENADLKQRLLPQFQGRAQRAEHERDALLEQLIAARSATGATRGKSEFEAGFDAGFAKAMLDLDPTNKAAQVEVGTITDAARYRYVRQHPEMLLHLSNKDFDAAIDKRRGSDDAGGKHG
jgi:hypothetical protein